MNNRQSLPKLIVYQGRIRFMQLKQFYSFLQLHEVLKYVPFVFNHGNEGVFDNDELYQMVRTRLFDNVISEADNIEVLIEKADTLGNLKRVRIEQSANYTTNTNAPVKCKSVDLFLKRAIDITVSSIALILLSPLLLLIALLVYLESGGPIFYISKRAGRGFDVFNFYKFRTMVVDADAKLSEYQQLNKYNSSEEAGEAKTPQFFKLKNDPRVTKMGAILRKTSLDELPQLFNVLIGNMSLVGNRPLPLYEAATLTNDECAERFEAPAGITGLWQISKRGKESMSVEERVGLDIEYSRKFSFLFDLKIMARTPKAMLQE
ncbi:MAG TPA: sugar transferase [Phnomibacter sp.]|nr:sugar transferase [Phnomibacter sp.]